MSLTKDKSLDYNKKLIGLELFCSLWCWGGEYSFQGGFLGYSLAVWVYLEGISVSFGKGKACSSLSLTKFYYDLPQEVYITS